MIVLASGYFKNFINMKFFESFFANKMDQFFLTFDMF